MDGIFVAYHNVERMFGFQYIPLSDMDYVLHGQSDSCLGDQEFRYSIQLMSELMEKATQRFPETSIRFHFETRELDVPFMYIFAEPMTEEEIDEIQSTPNESYAEFERNIIGIDQNDPRSKAEWQEIQERVEEEVENDEVTDMPDEANDDSKAIAEEHEDDVELDMPWMDGVLEHKDTDMEAEEAESEGGSEAESEERSTTPANHGFASNTDPEVDGSEEEVDDERPVMGWTLTIRNRVNGAYVERPQSLTPEDQWSVEYAIEEVPETKRRAAYETLKMRRKKLLTFDKKAENAYLDQFLAAIRKRAQQGRSWREKQDSIDAQLGKRVYRPMGPGSARDAGQ